MIAALAVRRPDVEHVIYLQHRRTAGFVGPTARASDHVVDPGEIRIALAERDGTTGANAHDRAAAAGADVLGGGEGQVGGFLGVEGLLLGAQRVQGHGHHIAAAGDDVGAAIVHRGGDTEAEHPVVRVEVRRARSPRGGHLPQELPISLAEAHQDMPVAGQTGVAGSAVVRADIHLAASDGGAAIGLATQAGGPLEVLGLGDPCVAAAGHADGEVVGQPRLGGHHVPAERPPPLGPVGAKGEERQHKL